MVRTNPAQGEAAVTRIEVLSNLSLTFDRLAGFFLVLSAVTLAVALLPTLLGYWPIMAIALIHLAVVGWCFRLAWRGNWRRQEIRVGPGRLVFDERSAHDERHCEWPTCRVRVCTERNAGDARVFLTCHGRRIEIGAFVPADERLEAARELARALRPHSAWSDNGIDETASSG
ncbi:MAG: DUF2244 domain-containing protein [Wenzhouxiangellaceae bacterium]|nr:DUF2244 domain-containing protein [Wenzhouxiangellaceae bacterium]